MIFVLLSKLFACCLLAVMHIQCTGSLDRRKRRQQSNSPILKMSVNNVWSCKQLNWEAICSLLSIMKVLAA